MGSVDIKVFLDDERSTSKGSIRTYSPTGVISLFKTGKIEALSLDYNLSDDQGIRYDLLAWLEQQVLEGQFLFDVPKSKVHSAQISARKLAIHAIKQQVVRISYV